MKTVTVRHTWRDEPDEKRIEDQIDWWASRGYQLVHRDEKQPGLLVSLLNWRARGFTELRFEKE